MLTADNFFSSFDLAISLSRKNIRFVGTLRSNKRQIPWQFLPFKTREVTSSLFGYNLSNDLTLVSYVTKPNKAVILISTYHNDFAIDTTSEKLKPEIITFYNHNKFAVDALDQRTEKNTVRRKTNRLLVITFFYSINTYI